MFCTIYLLEKYNRICRLFGERFGELICWADKLPYKAIRAYFSFFYPAL